MTIVVIDLDGVVFKSPVRETVNDPNFWVSFWENPEAHRPNKEIEVLIRGLCAVGTRILFLTARPKRYRKQTHQAIINCMGVLPMWCEDVSDLDFLVWPASLCALHMKPDQATDDWLTSGAWKLGVIEELKTNHEVLFAVEDFKPNAEEMRKAVPVLLYEQRRY